MKIADNFTGKLVIGSYDECNEDGVYGEPGCDYAVFPANEQILKVLREIKEVHNKLNGHFGSNFNQTNVKAIEFSFYGQVDFFGENPDKGGSKFYNSIVNGRRGVLGFYPVDRVDEDGFDSIREYRDGVISEFTKDQIRQTEDYDQTVIVYLPEWSTIYFRFNPDSSIDYKSYGINIDELIEYLEKNLKK
jgi:hypothetical protein